MALSKSFFSGGLRRMLQEKPHSPSTELISGNGEFNEAGFKNFLKSVKLHEHGSVVVAIIGQQSSGKSTLMNHLFGTDFKEMKPRQPRGATTKGIWTAKSLEMERLIIAVDLEGTDSRERGQDDKTFERQSGLFAAIIADVLIINMNCQNIGLDEGGNRPLLKVIFEAMMRLFGPRKTTLLFVLRNKTEVEIPFHMLESDLREDIEKIWETALKPPGHENTRLSQIFNVEVAALSSYKSAPNIFAEEVARLRSRLFDSISPRRRHNVEPAGSEVISFASAKTTWEIIKGCKDLDLPSHKEMVATVRCEEIAKDKLSLFESDTEWLALQQAAASSLVPGFCARTRSILDKYLSQYDEECKRYENDRVSRAKRAYLMSEASKVVRPAHMNTLSHGRSDALRSFETRLRAALREGGGFAESVRTCKEFCEHEFDECGSDDEIFSNDVSAVRRELLRDIENHWHLVRADELPQIAEQHRERLSAKLSRELRHILSNSGDNDTWDCIRSVVRDESDAAARALRPAIAGFELDQEKINEMVDGLRQKARELMENKFKEETHDVLALLNGRFMIALVPVEEGHQPTIEDAYRKCVKLLSTVAVIRLDEIEGDIISLDDDVESVLLSALMPPADQILPDPLASHTWEQVPPTMTLITPVRCRDIWNQFKQEREQHFANTMRLQEQFVVDNHWRPLTWVILGLLTLGGCAAFVVFIRNTNIDVLGYAVKGLGLAATGIGLASKGMDVVQRVMELWENSTISQAPNFTELFRRNRVILKTLKQALKKLNKRINSLLGEREAARVAA